MGVHQTNHCPDRQQVSHEIFPSQNDSTLPVERLRFRTLISLQNRPCTRTDEHSGRLPLPIGHQPQRKNPSPNQRRHPNNTHPGEYPILRHSRGKPVLLFPEDDSETEEDIWEQKQRARKKIYSPQEHETDSPAATNETNSQTENLPLVCNNIQDPEQEQRRQLHSDTSFPRSLRPHQDQDPVLRNLKLKMLKEQYDTQLLNDDPRATKYLTQEDRIIIKDGLLYRQYFGDNGKVKYLQVLLPKNWSTNSSNTIMESMENTK